MEHNPCVYREVTQGQFDLPQGDGGSLKVMLGWLGRLLVGLKVVMGRQCCCSFLTCAPHVGSPGFDPWCVQSEVLKWKAM